MLAKELADFSWELILYIQENKNNVLFVSEDTYKERMMLCKSCDKYDELENKCLQCGCYVPGKTKIILDSCPLNKWGIDKESWYEKFDGILKDLDISSESL